jgi:hypothetical protein
MRGPLAAGRVFIKAVINCSGGLHPTLERQKAAASLRGSSVCCAHGLQPAKSADPTLWLCGPGLAGGYPPAGPRPPRRGDLRLVSRPPAPNFPGLPGR